MNQNKIDQILTYWFGTLDEQGLASAEVQKSWWTKDAARDQQTTELFQHDLALASQGQYDDWKETAKGRLALIILLDQFSREIYRDTPKAFEQDEVALALCEEGIQLGHDKELNLSERGFFYMPYQHSEDRDVHERSITTYSNLVNDAPEHLTVKFNAYLNSAMAHKKIIDRFGQYPHRNKTVGRVSSDEEIEFLKQPGSSF